MDLTWISPKPGFSVQIHVQFENKQDSDQIGYGYWALPDSELKKPMLRFFIVYPKVFVCI